MKSRLSRKFVPKSNSTVQMKSRLSRKFVPKSNSTKCKFTQINFKKHAQFVTTLIQQKTRRHLNEIHIKIYNFRTIRATRTPTKTLRNQIRQHMKKISGILYFTEIQQNDTVLVKYHMTSWYRQRCNMPNATEKHHEAQTSSHW